jgi:hypothetical protein
VDAIDRADLDARVVLLADARLGNHVGQVKGSLLISGAESGEDGILE